jgi:hypothetical protein
MCEFDVPLDGILRHASTLCILRYQPQCNSTTDLGANTGRGPREEGSLAAPGQVLPVGRPVLPPLKHPDGATAPLPASIRTGTTGPLPVNPFPLAVILWRLSGTTPEVDRYYRRPDDRYYRPHHRYYPRHRAETTNLHHTNANTSSLDIFIVIAISTFCFFSICIIT